MIGKLIAMAVPAGIALGLMAVYLIYQGVSPIKTIAGLATAGILIAVLMVQIAFDDDDDDEEDENDDV